MADENENRKRDLETQQQPNEEDQHRRNGEDQHRSNGEDQQQKGTNEQRDWCIQRQLLSADTAVQNAGIDCLNSEFCELVGWLFQSRGRAGSSAVFRLLRDARTGRLDEDRYADLWQDVMVGVCANVRAGTFTADGSLLAYLLTIAEHILLNRLRKRSENIEFNDVERIAYTAGKGVDELLDDIEQHYDSLSEVNQLILRLGVTLASVNGSGRGFRALLVKTLLAIIRQNGWPDMTYESIVRRYNRLRAELRLYLRKRGYDV